MKISNYVTTRPKKLKDAIFPIFVVNWLSGLNIVEFPIGYPRPFLSVIYVLIMMILYYYNTFMGGIYSLDSSNMPTSSAIILNIFWFYNAFFGLVAIILSWHNQKVLFSFWLFPSNFLPVHKLSLSLPVWTIPCDFCTGVFTRAKFSVIYRFQ